MAAKVKMGPLGGMHTAGIFSDMTVDGPNIGTLVAIIDKAKNLPNRRSMGKQDPYCAARLGKEAKKTTTDKRGGQTPRWDQELRFTVHDSPDYHQLKVSIFNDDKKTELIGETYISLESVLTPGGGQSDSWHGLNCKGKYAGEIRIELTYYDSRPKAEQPMAEKRRETARTDSHGPSVGGPRESTPVKRRPLPSDPTGASPSPVATPEHRGLSGAQTGPRPLQPRQAEHTPTHQRRTQQPESQPQRRPLPDASPLNGTPISSSHTPQQTQRAPPQETYTPSHAPKSSVSTLQYAQDGFDMSYTAPKPYEVQPLDQAPQHNQSFDGRPISQNEFGSSHGHPRGHIDLPHSHSAPVVPTQHAYESEPTREDQYLMQSQGHSNAYGSQYADDHFHQDSQYQVQPLRTSRSNERNFDHSSHHDQYQGSNSWDDQQGSYDPFASHGRPSSAMQPTVEDEDDLPPPPPVHRSDATTLVHHQQPPPAYYGDAPAPLNINRYREDPQRVPYDSPPQSYGSNDYSVVPHAERRYTHPNPRASPQPNSRPVSRDTMQPSPLRQETSILPSSLVPGYDTSREENQMVVRAGNRDSRAYQAPQPYDIARTRQHSEPDYRTLPQYETSPRPNVMSHHQSMPSTESPSYYPHPPPGEPRHTSPVHDPAPIIKPRAVSPGYNHSPADGRNSRTPVRSMPTRKSVSPRPPPSMVDSGERRLSGVPFNPDSFDVLNPAASKKANAGAKSTTDADRRGSNVEINDKGQVVTFSGRVIDASDHLPLDSWAPEPEPKGPQKDRPIRERPTLNGARDIEGALQRERDYRRDRAERDRIRNAVNEVAGGSESPSNALVSSRHYYSNSNGSPMHSGAMVLADADSTPPGSGGRNRLQKRGQRPTSSYAPLDSSPSANHMQNSHVLRERENPRGYGGSPGYGNDNGRGAAAPPIPAKIPLSADGGRNEDMSALSLELSSIDIGPGSGGRQRGTARRRYGGY